MPIWPEDRGSDSTEKPPTPGERLVYALGQLYWLWRQGALDVAPADFDIEDVARIVGVARDIEFVSDCPTGCCYHFPAEVLVVDDHDFPWRLMEGRESH